MSGETFFRYLRRNHNHWSSNAFYRKGWGHAYNVPPADPFGNLIWFYRIARKHQRSPRWFWFYLGKASAYATRFAELLGPQRAEDAVYTYLRTIARRDPDFLAEFEPDVAYDVPLDDGDVFA